MVSEKTNGAKETIEMSSPYMISAHIVGVADLLFHRWNCEDVEAKSKAAKGSKAKKEDNIENYVYRNDDGFLCIPGENFRQSMILAAKFIQDPRSPRKSACDLYKAGIVSTSILCSLGKKEWDYEHKCRVTIQRAGITRTRPAMKSNWTCEVQFLINLPEYIQPPTFIEVLTNAGRLCGVCDFRPTYGRYQVKNWEVVV